MTCEIFDFWCWTSNEIIGDVWLAVFVYALVLMYCVVKLKMPKELQMMFLILLFAALFSKTLLLIIWVFLVLTVGVIFYWGISKKLGG